MKYDTHIQIINDRSVPRNIPNVCTIILMADQALQKLNVPERDRLKYVRSALRAGANPMDGSEAYEAVIAETKNWLEVRDYSRRHEAAEPAPTGPGSCP